MIVFVYGCYVGGEFPKNCPLLLEGENLLKKYHLFSLWHIIRKVYNRIRIATFLQQHFWPKMVATYIKVDQLDNFNRLPFWLVLAYKIKSFTFILKLDALKQNFRWQL